MVSVLFTEPPVLAAESPRFIPAPTDEQFIDVGWWAKLNRIVTAMAPIHANYWEFDIYTVLPDGTDLRRLPLPDQDGCKYTSRALPRVLPDGRLVYRQQCVGATAVDLPSQALKLMVYDPVTGSASQLLPYYLPSAASVYGFAPDLHVGIVQNIRGLFEELDWLYPDHFEKVNLPFARAGRVSWSPDGKYIAVDAVPDAGDRNGVDRLGLPRQFYLLSFPSLERRPLFAGFVNAGLSAWSPDSRWLVVPIYYSEREGDEALVLINVATGKVRRLLTPDQAGYGPAAWSPDGHWLVTAAVYDDQHTRHPVTANGLYIYDATRLNQLDR